MILREGSIMLLSGVALGLLLACGHRQTFSGMLYQVGALDRSRSQSRRWSLAAAALIATWLPARRATHVDPIQALRTE